MKKKDPLYLSIQEARAVARYALPGVWSMVETPDGWLAKRGQATLTTVNTRTPRHFKSLQTGIRWLKNELGLLEFKVVVMASIDDTAAHPV